MDWWEAQIRAAVEKRRRKVPVAKGLNSGY